MCSEMQTQTRDASRLDGDAGRHAAVLCDLRRWADAAVASGELITADTRSATAWCLMSRAQLGLGRARPALEAARTASSLDPSAEEPHRFASLAEIQTIKGFIQK